MIDQDYAELLGRSPPSGEVLEWTFPAKALANAFVTFLIGTPALCLTLYMTGLSREESFHSGGAELRVPTLTQLGIRSNFVGFGFNAGIELAAVFAVPLFWCVKLSHHQRLQARTGVARYDLQADGAVRWVTAAWVLGALGATLLFAAASVPGDEGGASFSTQGVTHLVLTASAACGFIGQAVCTAWAIRKARLVFVVSDADLVAYRRKICLASLSVAVAVVAILSVVLTEFIEGGTWRVGGSKGGGSSGLVSDLDGWSGGGGGGGSSDINDGAAALAATVQAEGGRAGWDDNLGSNRDCDTEWCYSRSLLGLWEYVLLVLEAGFCISLRHDLVPATGGVGVESFVL